MIILQVLKGAVIGKARREEYVSLYVDERCGKRGGTGCHCIIFQKGHKYKLCHSLEYKCIVLDNLLYIRTVYFQILSKLIIRKGVWQSYLLLTSLFKTYSDKIIHEATRTHHMGD